MPERRAALPPTKTVTVYRNGDAFFPGRKMVLNPRQVWSLEQLLSVLSAQLAAPSGTVRRLYTPTQGHRVQSLQQLQHGGAYVAAGNEAFKQLSYCAIATMKPQKRRNMIIKPVTHTRLVASARWKKITDGTCTINVFTNGEPLVPPVRIRIPKHTLKSWESVLSMVTQKVDLRTGAVFKLCRFDGQPVCGPTGLENNHYYVAVGTEKFKPLPYEKWVPNRNQGKKTDATQGQAPMPAARNKRAENNTEPVLQIYNPEERLDDLSFSTAMARVVCDGEDLELTVGGQMKEQEAKTERVEQQRQVSRNPALFTAGASSIFNAKNKRSEVEGAVEVQEDPQLKVDLPIDQVEARIVEEEHEETVCSANWKDVLPGSDAVQDTSHAGAGKEEGQEERKASQGLGRIRSRMSRFFKGRSIKA